jgi:hypothetical protein
MKNIILILLLLSSSLVSASEATCTGKVWFWTVFFPVPLHRNIILKINPSLSELNSPTQGHVRIDAEGEPIDYQGIIYPAGDHNQKMIDPNNGDITEFSINVLSSDNVRFSLNFKSSDLKAQGWIKPTTLSCH